MENLGEFGAIIKHMQPAAQLKDMADLIDKMRQYVNSREWWVLVPVDAYAVTVLKVIEHTYYKGAPAALDFELFMPTPATGCPVSGVFLARKSRMTAAQLAAALRNPKATEAAFLKRDIIILASLAGAEEISRHFDRWLESLGNHATLVTDLIASGNYKPGVQSIIVDHEEQCNIWDHKATTNGKGICDCSPKVSVVDATTSHASGMVN